MYTHLLITFASAHGVLRVADWLDHTGAAELRRRIDDARAAGCTVLEVDCARVAHIATPSLVELAATKAQLESRGGALRVTRYSRAFEAAARAGGFDELVPRDATPSTRQRIRRPM